MGALWTLDLQIWDPSIITKPIFYGLSYILRNQSVEAELNGRSLWTKSSYGRSLCFRVPLLCGLAPTMLWLATPLTVGPCKDILKP